MNKMYLVIVLLMFAGYSHAQTSASGRISWQGPQLCLPSATPDGVFLNNTPPVPGEKILGLTTIGNTWYDAQTYNAGNLMNRVYEHPDGTIGAIWMHQGAQGTPDRGSAYNYFNGSAWTGQAPHLGATGRQYNRIHIRI